MRFFVEKGYNFSYLYSVFSNVAGGEEASSEGIDRVVFFNANGNMPTIEKGESSFLKPYEEVQSQYFGDPPRDEKLELKTDFD